jgi:hypothetical protein
MRHTWAAVLIALVTAAPAAAQARDAQPVRLAVAEFLKAHFPRQPQFNGRAVVLDTAGLRSDPPTHQARTAAENTQLAQHLGATIGTLDDLPHCAIRYKDCTPLDKMAVLIGEPVFAGDSAVVSYRLSKAEAGTAPYIRSDQYLASVRKLGAGWAVVAIRPDNVPKQ